MAIAGTFNTVLNNLTTVILKCLSNNAVFKILKATISVEEIGKCKEILKVVFTSVMSKLEN